MQPTDKRIATVEQWQALKGVIDGNIGKARVLTTADYNYPTDNPTTVALWLLEPGIYTSQNGPTIRYANGNNQSSSYGGIYVVGSSGVTSSSDLKVILFYEGGATNGRKSYMVWVDTNGNRNQQHRLATDVIDNLTTTGAGDALDATQGKVLKDMIDAIVVPTKTSDLTNDSDFQTGTDVATAVGAVDAKLNGNVMTELTMATDATKVEFTETKKNLSTGTTSTEVDTIPLASTTQAGILNAAGYQSIIDSQDRLDALAGGAVSIANLSANPSQSELTTAWQTATGETTVFNRASIFDSTNGKNWTYFDNTSAWEVTGTVNQSITINNFSQGTAGLIVGDNTAGKVFAEQDGTGSVYGWDALNTRVTNVESATANIPSVVQTTGTSTTDVMSQNAVTSMIFADPSVTHRIRVASTQTVGDHSTTVGENAQGYGAGSTALGWGARVYGEAGIGIGREVDNVNTSYKGTVAIGTYSGTGITASGMMDIGTRNTTYGYNSSNYRLLTGLYDPQDDHDAANKEYVDNLAITYAALNGASAPTTATAGTYVGQLYLDTTNDKMYYLASIDDTADPVEYNWSEIGGGPNVVQTVGTSTTDVMSQKAVTDSLYADGASKWKIRIGANANPSGDYASAIGGNSTASGYSSLAIGNGTAAGYGSIAIHTQSSVSGTGAVGIGRGATTTQQGQFDIGAGTFTSYGYNNSAYRLLTGLYDGQSDHDAVTVGQLNTAIAGVSGAAEINSTDWSALWQ